MDLLFELAVTALFITFLLLPILITVVIIKMVAETINLIQAQDEKEVFK